MNCIITLCDSMEENCFSRCIQSQMDYARKINVDYQVLGNPDESKSIIFQKFNLWEIAEDYDRVLFLDADIYIMEDSPDIFEEYPDKDKFYILNEVQWNEIEYDRPIQTAIDKHNIKVWNKTSGHYDFYNFGVFIFSKRHKEIFKMDKDYFTLEDYPLMYEQPYMDYRIFKYNIPVEFLDLKWNAMVYFKNPGYFRHFANVHDRNEKLEEYINEL